MDLHAGRPMLDSFWMHRTDTKNPRHVPTAL